jgi:hypothetical protein
MDDDLIASEIHESVLNEFPNDGKNIVTCEEEIVDWNKYHIEEMGVIEGYEDRNSIENEFGPFVGQCFLSEEEAFIFYRKYANRCGLTIRKCCFVTKNGEKVRRDFFCHWEGKQPLKIMEPSKEQRNRESSKCGCNTHLRITLRKSSNIFPQEWHVTKFIVNHNHELLYISKVRFLPANRVITKDDEEYILLLKEVGLSVRQIMRVMELEKNVKHGHLPFFQRDIHNL